MPDTLNDIANFLANGGLILFTVLIIVLVEASLGGKRRNP